MHDITIAIPLFNSESVLPNCLRSIAVQTYPHARIQIVVVDDASPGGSAKHIVDSFQTENPAFEVVYLRHETNSGLLGARRTAVLASDGEFIFPLDPDDEIESDLCQRLLDAANSSAVDIVQCRMSQHGLVCQQGDGDPFRGETFIPGNETLHEFLKGHIHSSMCGKLIRRDLYVHAFSLLDEVVPISSHIHFMEDLLSLFALSLLSPSYRSLDFFGYRHNVVPSSASHGIALSDERWDFLWGNVKQVRTSILQLSAIHHFSKADTWAVENLFSSVLGNVIRLGMDQVPEHARYRRLAQWVLACNPASVFPCLKPTDNEAYKALSITHAYESTSRNQATANVAVVIQRFYLGGTERVIARLLSIWKQFLPEIHPILVTFEPPSEKDYPIPNGVVRIALDQSKDDYLYRFSEIVEEYSIDTVLVANVLSAHSAPVGAWSKLSGLRTIGMIHGSFAFFMAFGAKENHVRHYRYGMFDTLTCVSKIDAKVWRALDLPQSVHVRNPPPAPCQTDCRLEHHDATVLFVGRLSAEKRPELAIQVFALVCRRVPHAKLLIIGEPSPGQERLLEQCHALANELNIADSIAFCGFKSNVSEYFRRADVLMMTSRFEGAPVVVEEARCHAVPTVLMSLPYLDFVSENDGVVMTPQNDPEAMAEALVEILVNPKRRETLARNAKQCADAWTEARCADVWKTVFHPSSDAGHDKDPSPLSDETLTILHSFRDILFELSEANSRPSNRRIQDERRLRAKVEKQFAKAETRLAQMKASVSWRIGCMMTWPARALYERLRSGSKRSPHTQKTGNG